MPDCRVASVTRSRLLVAAIFFAVATVVASVAAAQVATGRKLSGSEIQATLPGKKVVYQRNIVNVGTRNEPRFVQTMNSVKMFVVFRPDNSLMWWCHIIENRTGMERPCQGDSARSVGVWEVRGDQICSASVGSRREQYACFELFFTPPRSLYLRQTNSVPSNAQGAAEFE